MPKLPATKLSFAELATRVLNYSAGNGSKSNINDLQQVMKSCSVESRKIAQRLALTDEVLNLGPAESTPCFFTKAQLVQKLENKPNDSSVLRDITAAMLVPAQYLLNFSAALIKLAARGELEDLVGIDRFDYDAQSVNFYTSDGCSAKVEIDPNDTTNPKLTKLQFNITPNIGKQQVVKVDNYAALPDQSWQAGLHYHEAALAPNAYGWHTGSQVLSVRLGDQVKDQSSSDELLNPLSLKLGLGREREVKHEVWRMPLQSKLNYSCADEKETIQVSGFGDLGDNESLQHASRLGWNNPQKDFLNV